ncbi:hypothetical protein BAU15_01620 [Enterococcus sp. JM4C]|uniref:hypothetical protein n=1 Tax=Candidatus Enterococcus huntleyi TaxID=1857217 RepID=UPI00137945B1|nr:hypothetical protein [Enterococcus sp. JM4C]KAF1299371.1 hypothetical protein BAU15_01620 [Enterococcus sp. JM4C]
MKRIVRGLVILCLVIGSQLSLTIEVSALDEQMYSTESDQVTVSTESERTEATIGTEPSTLSSGVYNSADTGNMTGDSNIDLPDNTQTDWQLQLADDELSMTLDPQDNQPLIHAESGNWANYSGDKEATLAYQVDGGARQTVPAADLNQTDKTFQTMFDLSTSDQTVADASEHTVVFYLTIDGVTQEDSLLVHEQVTTNKSPMLTTTSAQLSVPLNDTGIYKIDFEGVWQDEDSHQTTLSGKYSDNSAIDLPDNTFTNTDLGTENNFSIRFETAAGKLTLGENQLEFWLMDNEDGTSEQVLLTVTVTKNTNELPIFTLTYPKVTLNESTSGTYTFSLKGSWLDSDSDQVTIEGKYPDKTAISLTDASYPNEHKGTTTRFSLDIKTEAGKIKYGENVLEFTMTDSDNGMSTAVEFIVDIRKKTNYVPVLKVEPTDFELMREESGDYSFTINGRWSDNESSSVSLKGEYVDKSTFTSEDYPNPYKGQLTAFSLDVTVPVEKLNASGSNQLDLVAIDKEGATSQVITLHFTLIAGTIQFDEVADHSSFQAVKLANDPVISHANDDWVVNISDTTNPNNEPPTWRLEATQETPLENSNTQHALSSTIEYKNAAGQVTPLAIGVPVAIDMQQDTTDQTKYNLGWSDTEGFQLPVSPSEPVGDYSTTIQWTIVEAP